MKRPLTLIGAILGLIANATILVINSILLLALFGLVGEENGKSMLFLALLGIVVFLINIILNFIVITAWQNDANKFKKKKVLIIFAILFNIGGAIIAFLMQTTQHYILASVIILSAVLFTLDLALEKRRAAKAYLQTPELIQK